MKVNREITELLLLSKSILDRIRFQVGRSIDRHSLALRILAAHDAAELSLSAIANATHKLPTKDQRYLMDYFEPLKALHPEREVPGKGYFNQLNRVRIGIKHHGIFPDPLQWETVGEKTFSYISEWCTDYLDLSLEELDESVLFEDKKTKQCYQEAKECATQGNHRLALEKIAFGLHEIFKSNPAVRGLMVGHPRAEDAIKLATFGVQANDFLTLQHFLPRVISSGDIPVIHWTQEEFGHPGNWRQETSAFCLRAFLDVILKIQHAPRTPGPARFDTLYEYKITPVKESAQIWNLPEGVTSWQNTRRNVLRTISKGEFLIGSVELLRSNPLMESVMGIPPRKEVLEVSSVVPDKIHGYVLQEDVNVVCVPKDNEYVRMFFPDLPEIEWEKGQMLALARAHFGHTEEKSS
jgi:hypothetical protein